MTKLLVLIRWSCGYNKLQIIVHISEVMDEILNTRFQLHFLCYSFKSQKRNETECFPKDGIAKSLKAFTKGVWHPREA